MTRVYFMCGPAGSGKSTFARRLEAQGWVRLSFDVEAGARGITSMPLSAQTHAEIEQILLGKFRTAIASGQDVVFDYSFWSFEMRDKYRTIVRAEGIEPEVIYMQTDRATALAAVAERQNTASRSSIPSRSSAAGHESATGHTEIRADEFTLSPDLAAQYFDKFQPPTPDEGPLTVITRAVT